MLTTPNAQDVRLGSPSSGWDFPPSVPAGPWHRPGRGFRAPAFILSLAALFLPHFLAWLRSSNPTSSVGLRFTPLKRCAGASVVRSCPSPVGQAHPIRSTWGNFLRARLTGFSHRVGAPTTLTVWGSGPSLYPSSPECVEGVFSEVTPVHL